MMGHRERLITGDEYDAIMGTYVFVSTKGGKGARTR